MADKKKALTDAERQARRREKAAADGFISCSVGLVRVEHIDTFKSAARLSRDGQLILDSGELFKTKNVQNELVVAQLRSLDAPEENYLVLDGNPSLEKDLRLGGISALGYLKSAKKLLQDCELKASEKDRLNIIVGMIDDLRVDVSDRLLEQYKNIEAN
jgi:hypothetical protein